MTLDGTKSTRTMHWRQHQGGKGEALGSKIGGGGLGMLDWAGIASGGNGPLIGGLDRWRRWNGGRGPDRYRDLEIPAESIVHSKLSEDVALQHRRPKPSEHCEHSPANHA